MDAALLSLVTQSSRHSLAAAGSSVVWGRDQDVALDFPTLAKALTKVARGEVRPGGLLVRARGHACLRSKRAPCQGLNSLQGRRSAAWRGVQGSNTWWCIMRVCVCAGRCCQTGWRPVQQLQCLAAAGVHAQQL